MRMCWRALVVILTLGCEGVESEDDDPVIDAEPDIPLGTKAACREAADCESQACLPEQLFKDADCEAKFCCAEPCPCEGVSQVCTIFDDLEVCIEG
jgi:hypothetical protein